MGEEMTDRELLELAAKAAGIEVVEWRDSAMTDGGFGAMLTKGGIGSRTWWNPLTDDGDALRLAVKLGVIIDVRYTKPEVAEHNCVNYWLPGEEHHGWSSVSLGEHTDPYAATRRAIVRAAAAMAEGKQ